MKTDEAMWILAVLSITETSTVEVDGGIYMEGAATGRLRSILNGELA